MLFSKRLLLFCLLLSVAWAGFAQTERRVISTAVPFLNVTPDARSAGMGDAGVAVSADANAVHWNVSKLAFTKREMGFSMSYTPWLQNLVPDMWVAYLSGFKRVSKNGVATASLRYFDLGSMQFTNQQGQIIQDFNPREIALDAGYAMQLSKNFSMGVTARYVHSNLTGNVSNSNVQLNATPGNTLAADISAFYQKDYVFGGLPTNVAFGATISNIGQKITYNDVENADFIPTNLRIGTAITTELDAYNKITFALDVNKLLVPSPPIYDQQGNIIKGKDPKRPLLSGIFGSFTDAPNGISEEMQELMYAAGLEYWYNNIFAVRGGYFYEHVDKGNRKYFTVGVGVRYNAFGVDFAYMMPQQQGHPLADTMRFTLLFDFDKKSKKEDVTN